MYSSKTMPNGWTVACRTYYPGPYDGLAGLSSEIVTTYSVFVGWEEYNIEYEQMFDAPPLSLPMGATGWGDATYDGPRNWYAEFDDVELAEQYAAALAPYEEGMDIAPLVRAVISS
jgi:hypothetical protein